MPLDSTKTSLDKPFSHGGLWIHTSGLLYWSGFRISSLPYAAAFALHIPPRASFGSGWAGPPKRVLSEEPVCQYITIHLEGFRLDSQVQAKEPQEFQLRLARLVAGIGMNVFDSVYRSSNECHRYNRRTRAKFYYPFGLWCHAFLEHVQC